MWGDAAVRYLWEVLLEAKEEGIPEERLRFFHDRGCYANFVTQNHTFVRFPKTRKERKMKHKKAPGESRLLGYFCPTIPGI